MGLTLVIIYIAKYYTVIALMGYYYNAAQFSTFIYYIIAEDYFKS